MKVKGGERGPVTIELDPKEYDAFVDCMYEIADPVIRKTPEIARWAKQFLDEFFEEQQISTEE